MDAEALVGSRIGNYEIKRLLGKGGMGAVYLGEHPRIGRQVAVKVMSPEISGLVNAPARFEAEARLISRIDHPNVVQVYDFDAQPDGGLYYTMELLRGQTLSTLLERQGRMTAEEAEPFVAQICGALQAAHDQGVVHRDLKPENVHVLEGEPPRLKILDFGIAKLLESEGGVSQTQTGLMLGTPLFVAPEQGAREHHRIGPHTDIYSLGVLLYLMLGGEHPFWDPTPEVVVAMHIYEPPPPLDRLAPDLPADVIELVHRCMQKSPDRRPRSADEVALAFAAALEAGDGAVSPAQDTGSARSPETPPRGRMSRRAALLAAALALMAGAAAALYSLGGQAPAPPARPNAVSAAKRLPAAGASTAATAAGTPGVDGAASEAAVVSRSLDSGTAAPSPVTPRARTRKQGRPPANRKIVKGSGKRVPATAKQPDAAPSPAAGRDVVDITF